MEIALHVILPMTLVGGHKTNLTILIGEEIMEPHPQSELAQMEITHQEV